MNRNKVYDTDTLQHTEYFMIDMSPANPSEAPKEILCYVNQQDQTSLVYIHTHTTLDKNDENIYLQNITSLLN